MEWNELGHRRIREQRMLWFDTSKGRCFGEVKAGRIVLGEESLNRIRKLYTIDESQVSEGFKYRLTFRKHFEGTDERYWIILRLEDSSLGDPEYLLTLGQ